jgi:steroid delta-isomerase-like uncharacterized protein
MSGEENKAVVRRFLELVIDAGDMGAADAVCAEDFAWHGVGVGDLRGLATIKQAIAPFFTAFPDLRVEIHDLLADGDKVVARYVWRGTQRGEFFGVPATGRAVEVAGTSIYRVAGGKLAEEWWLEDMLGLMQQLGAVPAPGQGGAG